MIANFHVCLKPQNIELECIYCKNHPRNYCECEVVKEVQNIKIKNLRKSVLPQTQTRANQQAVVR